MGSVTRRNGVSTRKTKRFTKKNKRRNAKRGRRQKRKRLKAEAETTRIRKIKNQRRKDAVAQKRARNKWKFISKQTKNVQFRVFHHSRMSIIDLLFLSFI